MNPVHARCDDNVIQEALESNRQPPVRVFEKIDRFEQELENNQSPEVDAEERDGRDTKGNRHDHFAKVKAHSRAHVHVEIGMMHIMKTPHERNKMQGHVPPPIQIIHQQNADDDEQPVWHLKREQMQQSKVVIRRPNRR